MFSCGAPTEKNVVNYIRYSRRTCFVVLNETEMVKRNPPLQLSRHEVCSLRPRRRTRKTQREMPVCIAG